ILPMLALSVAPALGQSLPGADATTLPLEQWLRDGEIEQIRWNFDLDRPGLRMDQRFEVAYSARVRVRDLEPGGSGRDLIQWNWVRGVDGQWLAFSGPIRHRVAQDLAGNAEIAFRMQLFLVPGEYALWSLLYDESSHRRSLVQERIRVDTPDDDLF